MHRSLDRVPGLAVLLVFLAAIGRPPGHGITATARIYVDQAAGGANDGTSWRNAYTDLATALAAATAPAELWVAAGVFVPGTVRTDTFTLPSGIAIYGGFAGGETALDQRDPATNRTVLSGDTGGTGPAADNAYHVVTAPGDATAILDGVVVSDGLADGANPFDDGAGIYTANGSPTIRNTVVRNNRAIGTGGGMLADTGSVTLESVTFEGNIAGAGGGGLAIITGTAVLDRVVFEGNVASAGGGLFFGGTSLSVADATFSGNHAVIGGGAYGAAGATTIERSLFTGNASDNGAGGLDVAGDATVTNSTFWGNRGGTGGAIRTTGELHATFVTVAHNSATVAGGGIWAGGGNTDQVLAGILWGNEPDQFVAGAGDGDSIEGGIVDGGCPAMVACTAVTGDDPKLVRLAANGGPTATAAIKAGSPAIDVMRSGPGCPSTDQRGALRPVDGDKSGSSGCDLGAFEYAPAAPIVQFAAATSTGSEGAGTLKLAVQLNTTAGSAVRVKYAVVGGTASGNGKDFTLKAGTLTFPRGVKARTITVALVNDRLDEKNETIRVKLSAPVGATLGVKAQHTATIVDDDPRRACRGRLATIVGTDGKDVITGTSGPDVIVALGGNDTVDGGSGDDVICAGPGADRVKGGRGNDALLGQGDNDRLEGDAGADLLFGGGGNDTLTGGPSGGDACSGGPGKDALGPQSGCESKSGVP